MKKLFCLVMFVSLFSVAAFADIRLPDEAKPTPKPKPTKSYDSKMTIRLDQNASEATLVIPKNRIKQLRAELELLDDESDTAAVLSDSNGGVSRTQTIVGGMFLSLAFVFGGVWFTRSRTTGGKINKTIAVGMVVFLVGSAATIAFANIGPPMMLRTISSKLFDKKVFGRWKRADGNIKIQVSAENDGVELIIPDKEEKSGTDTE